MSSHNSRPSNPFLVRVVKRLAVAVVSAGAALSLPAVDLTTLISGINQPVGVGYHDGASASDRFLVVSANRDTPDSVKFFKVTADGYISSFAYYLNTVDWVKELPVGAELKLVTIRNMRNNTVTAGGFTLGDTFCGTGIAGQIMRINADGSARKTWSTIGRWRSPLCREPRPWSGASRMIAMARCWAPWWR